MVVLNPVSFSLLPLLPVSVWRCQLQFEWTSVPALYGSTGLNCTRQKKWCLRVFAFLLFQVRAIEKWKLQRPTFARSRVCVWFFFWARHIKDKWGENTAAVRREMSTSLSLFSFTPSWFFLSWFFPCFFYLSFLDCTIYHLTRFTHSVSASRQCLSEFEFWGNHNLMWPF